VDKIITLRDKRKLGYEEYGDPHGKPVFLFHGIPGSRIFHPPDEITTKLGVHLITVDRPGYGLSSFQPGRRILDWPGDVIQLANHLGIKRVAVAGHSGGGPYAAVCGYGLPGRVTAAAIVCGIGPLDTPAATKDMWWLNRVGFTTGRYMPWLLWQIPIWFFYRKGASKPADVMERGADSRPEADELLWEDPAIRNVCYASTVEAFRQGTRGQAWDVRLISRQWGFRLEDIHVPVFLWHGEADRDTPVTMGRYVASKIPGCRATICEGEAHLLIFPYWEEILQSLISP